MSKLRKNSGREKTKISTASLPDIVFMMLFFFMISATIKEEKNLVKTKLPVAKELTKAEQKRLIKEIKVGLPSDQSSGEQYKIAAEGKFLSLSQIPQWVNEKRAELPEYDQNRMIILLKVDENVEMGIIADIQQELRKTNARKILYRTLEE